MRTYAGTDSERKGELFRAYVNRAQKNWSNLQRALVDEGAGARVKP